MDIKPNIGLLNALIRITAGFFLLSWCTAKLVKRPWRDSYLFIALCGAMKVAEGIVRYCPVTELFQKYQHMQQQDSCCGTNNSIDGMEGVTNVDVPYNPT